MSRRDLTVEKLVCLSRSLIAGHPQWVNANVYIFDAEFAAAVFEPAWEMSLPGRMRDSRGRSYGWWEIFGLLRATLSVRRGSEPFLTITPLGFEYWSSSTESSIASGAWEDAASAVWNAGQEFKSTIRIADASTECKVGMFGRCLLIATPLRYPPEALESGVGARVTLSGELAKDGRVRNIRVETPAGPAAQWESAFITEATRHLGSLRFEDAQRAQPLRLTYEFAVAASVPYPHLLQVELGFPDRVTVTASEQRARRH